MSGTDDVDRALAEIADCLAAIKVEAAHLPPLGPAAQHTRAIVSLVQDAESQLDAIEWSADEPARFADPPS